MDNTSQQSVELLRAVLRHPDETAPRQAYAAWLDARGEPLGAFILLQLALSEIERAGGPESAWRSAYEQSQALLAEHKSTWEAPLRDRVIAQAFHRGFVEEITIDTRAFLDQAADLYAIAPIRHVNLRNAAGLTAELAASPHLARLVSLSLWRNGIGDEGLRELIASPHLHRVAWLDLSFNDIGETGLEALAACSHLSGLRYLGFAGNRAPDPAAQVSRDIDGSVLDVVETELGRRLESTYGPLPWIHAVEHFPPPHPPGRRHF